MDSIVASASSGVTSSASDERIDHVVGIAVRTFLAAYRIV
jgi:AefR-like transcriptional repressor, C-terminal domain